MHPQMLRARHRSGRLRFLGTALTAGAILATSLAAPAQAAPTHRDGGGFTVPDAALVRPLGDIPQDTSTPFPVPHRGEPGLGIPLGGVGAGSFMVNQSGTFGPWSFGGERGSSWEMRTLPQAAFHVREQAAGQEPLVRTLATDAPVDEATGELPWQSPLPAWPTLEPGEGSYAALYPFGYTSYEPFATDVSMRFWSPIEAGQDRRTSLPVAYFDVQLENNGNEKREVSTMFTMPNAPAHVAGTNADQSIDLGPEPVREGFSSRYQKSGSLHAVTLSADSPENTPGEAMSEWTIAADVRRGQTFSYTTSWDADGSGEDVWAPFAEDGTLPDAPIDASSSAGAIAVTATLKPGESTTIPFVLAWDFPQVAFADDTTVWMRHYTNFYGAQTTLTNDYIAGSYAFHQGFAIASDALRDRTAALRAVEGWWKPIATEEAYPTLLRSAALNQLYQNVWNNSFWEGGLVRTETVATGFDEIGPGQRVGASTPDSHLFGITDTIAGGQSGMGETTSIQAWNYLANFRLFPNVHRDRILAQIESVGLSPNGNAHNMYSVRDNPYITWGNDPAAFIQGGVDSRPPDPGTSQWIDTPSKFMFEWYAFAQSADDREVLERAWPAMKSEIAWLQGTIADGDHLPSDGPIMSNPFNIVTQGPGPALHNSSLYLLALNVAIASGQELGVDAEYVADLQQDLAAAKGQFEQLFWDAEGGHYRFATAGPWTEAATVTAFAAQHLAEAVGLPDIIDPERHRTQLQLHHDDFLAYDEEGELVGASLLWQEGGVADENGNVPFEVDWVMVGDNFTAAADLYATGKRFGDQALMDDGLELAEAVAHQVWTKPENGLAFATPWAWFPDDAGKYVYPGYSQGLAIWDVLDAIEPVQQAAMRDPAKSSADIRALLEELRSAGGISGPVVHRLERVLDVADRQLRRGRTEAAVTQLERFVRELGHVRGHSNVEPWGDAALRTAVSDVLALLRN